MAGADHTDDHRRGHSGPRSYASSHGNARRVLHEGQGPPPSRAAGAGASGVPTVGALQELNRRIHDDAGTPERYKLDQPSPLQSCLERARAAYEPNDQGVVRTAALLAHGIAQAQAFRDGNRRTAYFATQSFLHTNGYDRVSPEAVSDDTLARYLNHVVQRQATGQPAPGPEKFESLFRRRLERRRNRRSS